MQRLLIVLALGATFLVSACAGDPPARRGPQRRPPFHPASESMEKYDTNKDGQITTAEFNAALRIEYAAADTNHDGVLDLDEMRVVNSARIAQLGSAASPLIDWNQDGRIDFHEYSGGPKALFAQFDADEDGILSKDELHPPHRPPPPQRTLQVHP